MLALHAMALLKKTGLGASLVTYLLPAYYPLDPSLQKGNYSKKDPNRAHPQKVAPYRHPNKKLIKRRIDANNIQA